MLFLLSLRLFKDNSSDRSMWGIKLQVGGGSPASAAIAANRPVR